MAKAGDNFMVELTKAQLEWGTYRFTGSRGTRYGEGYLKIPLKYARLYHLYNNNHTNNQDILGENIFHALSKDGLFDGFLRSQGCTNAGDPFAKQFAGNKDLTALGDWYSQINAQEGDLIRVTFISFKDIIMEIM